MTPEPQTNPAPNGWEHLLERVPAVVGLEVDTERVRSIAYATLASEEDWEERLLTACEAMGLHAIPMQGTVANASNAVGPEHPVVAFDRHGSWWLLTDRQGRRVEVERPSSEKSWVGRKELGSVLDPEDSGEVRFIAIEPPGFIRDPEDDPPRGKAKSASGDTSPWVRLRALMRQERHDVVVTFVYAVGVGVLTLATPIAVQALVNTVAFGTLLQPLAILTMLLLFGLAFAGVLRALQTWVVEILQRRLFVRLVNDLSHRLPRVELAAFDRAHGPELVNRFFDLFIIQKSASSLLIAGLEIVLSAVVGMIFLAFYHPLLLAFDVLLMAVVFGILVGLGRGATKTAVKESKSKYEVAGWLEEVARHPIAFKLAGGPSMARQRADELASAYLLNRKRHFSVVFRQLVGALALQAFASAGILGIGGWLVIERQLTLGQLVASELIVTMVVASFAKIGKHLETTYDLLAALDKVGQLVDLPLESEHRSHKSPPASDERGARLEVRGLSFGFDKRTPLFSNVAFEVEPGERIILDGQSGSGRSALVDVLLGLRDANSGQVEIDGTILEDIDRAALRERTALVRGTEIVVGTIADNVAFGRRHIDAAAIRTALKAVDLLEVVSAFPDGLMTRVMPDGSPLSRGEAQRLMLARAIAGNPSLMVIDGALDGLDHGTLGKLLTTTFADNAPWTLLVISDHPDVRSRCARVLQLSDGQISDPIKEER